MELRKGFCGYCGQFCEAIKLDYGIGQFEYGSIREVHHDYYWGSPCCESGLVSISPLEEEKRP